jgi:hypothetical protein
MDLYEQNSLNYVLVLSYSHCHGFFCHKQFMHFFFIFSNSGFLIKLIILINVFSIQNLKLNENYFKILSCLFDLIGYLIAIVCNPLGFETSELRVLT